MLPYGKETMVVSLHHRLFILCMLKQNFLWLKCKKSPGNLIATYLQLLEKHFLDSPGDTEKKKKTKRRDFVSLKLHHITQFSINLLFSVKNIPVVSKR